MKSNLKRFEAERSFLKDHARQQVDFAQTPQNRHVAPPPLQKPCPPEVRRIKIPDGAEAMARLGCMTVGEAIRRRESVRDYTASPLTLKELSALLWATQGVREVISNTCALRTVPSAGARHSFETYLAVMRVESLEPGLYRYCAGRPDRMTYFA